MRLRLLLLLACGVIKGLGFCIGHWNAVERKSTKCNLSSSLDESKTFGEVIQYPTSNESSSNQSFTKIRSIRTHNLASVGSIVVEDFDGLIAITGMYSV